MQDHHIPTPDTGRRLRAPETWDAARAGETQRRLAVHVRLAEHARDAQREALRSERELHQLHQLHRALPDPAPPDSDSPDPPLSRADRAASRSPNASDEARDQGLERGLRG